MTDIPLFSYLYEEPGPRTKKITNIATAASVIAIVALLGAILYRFYITGQLDSHYWFFFTRLTTWSFLGKGLLGTIESAALSGAIAFGLGFILMLARISRYKLIHLVGSAIIEFTRGVPTLLFIYFFFLEIPALGIQMNALFKLSLPVAISACGVVAEQLRSGVYAVPKGQKEAALSLGLSNCKTFTKIIFPQALRYVTPALIAELVIVVKDTTFAYILSFPDLMQNAKVLISNYDAMLSVYLLIALLYIIINYILNKISAYISQKGFAGQRRMTSGTSR